MAYRETFLQIQRRLLHHFIRKSRIPGALTVSKHTSPHVSQDRQPEIQSSLVREEFQELWCRPTTTADFRSSL